MALREVVEDGLRCGVERWWVLGDIVALGPDPVGVLELLTQLSEVSFVAGNTERYVLTGDRPYPSFDDVVAHPDLMPRLVEVATSFAWTRGMVTQAGWLPWLTELPGELRWTLPDGTRGARESTRRRGQMTDLESTRGSSKPNWWICWTGVGPIWCLRVTHMTRQIESLVRFER